MLALQARRFRRALADPRGAQQARWQRLLPALADSEFGRAHRLTAHSTLDDFRRQVPVRAAPDFAPWVARLAQGSPDVRRRTTSARFERPAGGTPVPWTRALERELAAAREPWLFDLLGTPGLQGTRQGVLTRTAWNSSLQRLPRSMCVEPSTDDCATTLRELLPFDDLGSISSASATPLIELMTHLSRNFEASIDGLPRQRLRGLRDRLAHTGRLVAEAIWPRLTVISTPLEGAAARHLPALRTFFPNLVLRDPGVASDDGVISISLRQLDGQGSVLAVTSHLLEFVDLERTGAEPLLAHQLIVGGVYSPIVTCGNGLTRLRLGQVVRCTGRHVETPIIRLEHVPEPREAAWPAAFMPDSASIDSVRAPTLPG